MAFKMVLTCNCIAGHWLAGLRFYSTHKLAEPGEISDCFLCSRRRRQCNAAPHKQFLSGASWRRAGLSRWGPRYGGSKSFGFPGLRGRKPESFGYRYGGDLDGAARSHTLAAEELLVN